MTANHQSTLKPVETTGQLNHLSNLYKFEVVKGQQLLTHSQQRGVKVYTTCFGKPASHAVLRSSRLSHHA